MTTDSPYLATSQTHVNFTMQSAFGKSHCPAVLVCAILWYLHLVAVCNTRPQLRRNRATTVKLTQPLPLQFSSSHTQ